MTSRLLVSLRSLSLNTSGRSLVRGLATVSDTPESAPSTSDKPASTPSLTHQWQPRPARKLSARRRAIPPHVSPPAETPEGHLRPNLQVEVNDNHGLYGFFRAVRDEVSGVVDYETIVPRHRVNDYSGRAWLASELRRKSFKDLHTLWYVLARERNLLATQAAEARRLNIQCRKSMARIKQEGAVPEPEPETSPTEPKTSLFEAEQQPHSRLNQGRDPIHPLNVVEPFPSAST
ncbi:Mitochondrial 39-S ribosomal protein L47 (MRP-L47) [Rhizoctonia solani]|uniref:Large ribosomal subunit protein uL29m n=1 Tax=Rhizoctonia solani TaxID=456999 RepID=A0A8H7IBS8_9AGAM|nr:Mitochondrial 39-S ribosomal protein L47 (MRP-L47) [Rhizoctonia solani]